MDAIVLPALPVSSSSMVVMSWTDAGVKTGASFTAVTVIELVPESVARENAVLPLDQDEDSLRVIVSDPFDIETIEKLRFILNRRVETALAPRESILESINRYYGQVEGESADSMLQEFTDTAIDFTETEENQQDDDEVDENEGEEASEDTENTPTPEPTDAEKVEALTEENTTLKEEKEILTETLKILYETLEEVETALTDLQDDVESR